MSDLELVDGLQPVPVNPHGNAAEIALSPFGSTLVKDGIDTADFRPRVTNKNVIKWRGIGIAPREHDGRILNCVSNQNHAGIYVPDSDYRICFVDSFDNRDYNLKIASAAGCVKSQCCHYYGARLSVWNAGGTWASFDNDIIADAPMGCFSDGCHSTWTGVTFQHNSCRDLVQRAGWGHLMNCLIFVQREVKLYSQFNVPGFPAYTGKVGLELGDGCSLMGGTTELCSFFHPAHELTGRPAQGIWVWGNKVSINETHLRDDDGIDGTAGIVVKRRPPTPTDDGWVKGLTIDIPVENFHDSTARALIVERDELGRSLVTVNATFRVDKYAPKGIGGYIDIGAGWKGSIKIQNDASGVMSSLTKGVAY